MAILFSDNFNRADGATVDATNWTETIEADWSILTNQLRADVSAPPAFIITTTAAHAAVADCKASITRRTGTSFDGGPVARSNSAGSTCYYLDIYGTNNVEIYRRVAGVDTLVATRNTTHANGDVYMLEVSGTGATVTLKAFKNGVQMGADVSDTHADRIVTAGQTGVMSWGGALMDFDDSLVEDLAGAVVPLPLPIRAASQQNTLVRM